MGPRLRASALGRPSGADSRLAVRHVSLSVLPRPSHSGPDAASEPALAFRSIADDARHLAAKLWRVHADAEGADVNAATSHEPERTPTQ